MFMLGPKPLSVYDQQLKHGLGYPNPYTLKQAISQCPKLYLASSLGTIDYAQINALYKDFVPQKELSAEQKYFPSSFIPSDKNSNATPSIPTSMPKIRSCEIEQLKKKSIEIQEGLQARIKILEKDVQRCEKQSVDFELKLQHEKEKHKWDSSFKNKNTNPLDYSWISKMEKLEDENVSLDFTVQSLIKECDNVKLEYQKLFNSIKKTRSQTQMEMDELIAHVSEKTYAYGAIRAENQNLLFTISELKTRLANVEKGMNAASSVRRPMNRDSHVKNSVLANSKKPAKKVAVYVVQIVMWIVDSGCSKHMTGDRLTAKKFLEEILGMLLWKMIILQPITCMVIIYSGQFTICHVYYVEGHGHNLFSIGQFCDGDLEVAFRSKNCYSA
ncbi:hypothetical protein Tco_0494709 [Tanacetum coccineum]